ncbi:hypothetical protein BC332_13529 [Capsicum chinense]|nr:hypothetical protein BC332_13529 [Capsicum chinense]
MSIWSGGVEDYRNLLVNSKRCLGNEAVVEENAEGEEVQPPERSFWAKYWMYLIPLGLIVMNAMTQAMNMAEEQTSGQAGVQGQQAIGAQRAQKSEPRSRKLPGCLLPEDAASSSI